MAVTIKITVVIISKLKLTGTAKKRKKEIKLPDEYYFLLILKTVKI